MSLAPVKGLNSGDDPAFSAGGSVQYNLSFESGQTDLQNIDMQKYYADVVHKVQSEDFQLRNYVGMSDNFKGTFKWVTLTDKRDPKLQKKALPTIDSKKQTFETVGLQCNPYTDDSFLIDFTVRNARINVQSATLESMMKGFNRLMDKVAIAAMLQPKLKQSSTEAQYRLGQAGSATSVLANTRIGGRVTGAGSTAALANPNFDTFQKILRKFWDNNVSRKSQIYGLLTPGMEELMRNISEFKNRDYIYHALNSQGEASVDWMGITWVKVTPEITPGAFYADKYLLGAAASDLADATATSASNVDLSDSNHEVVPIWIKENIRYHDAMDLTQAEISRIPYYRNQPALMMTKWLGSTRIQDVLQYNLVIPA